MKVTKSTSFPLGSNIYSAVHIASQGLLAFDGPQSMAGAALDPLSNEAFLAPMNGIAGIVPAEGGSLSYYISPTNFVVTWNNVYACRTNLYPISYQAELKDNGDFSYRFAFSSNFVNSSVATNFKVANLGPAGAVMSFATDSDGDGFEDWKELLAGTLINDSSSRPVADDGVATLFSATITLASKLPEPVLLTLGGRRVMLREPGSTTLWLNEGVANTLSLRAVHGCDVSGLSIAVDSSYASYAGDDKPFNGTVRLRSGEQTKFGMVVQPVVSTASNWICFHDEPTRNAHAFVLPEDCPGYPQWAENGSNFTITDSGSLNAILNWYGAPGCDHLYFEYCLPGAAARRNAYVHVTRCAGHGSSTSSESSSAAVAVNNDDDDGNETDDLSDSTVEGENDLHQSRPIYGHGQSCCPCYGYGPNLDIIATRTHCSGRLLTYTSPSKMSEKTAAFPGDPVFVEGREASPSVGAEKIVWSWSEEGEAKASTNYYTVFSVRLFGDYNFDGAINSVDYSAANNLTEHGWPMLVASNMFHKVELKTDVLIPGYKILSLTGDAQIKVWTTPYPTINDTPLLITGQTVTNGFAGAGFGAYLTSMLYVEALDSGVTTLTYSYVGTGSAKGFGCSALLGVTVSNVKVEFISGGQEETTNTLHIAKWEQAFTNGYYHVPGHTFTNALFRTPEFISADSERFKIRVTDEDRLDQDTVMVQISTDHPHDTLYNTPQRVIELQRTEPGVFVSTNLLLVSDWEDFTFNAVVHGCAPNTTNRTLLSQLGSSVRVEYCNDCNMTNIVHASVGSNTKTVMVDVAIMRINGVECVDSLYALAQVGVAKERMAQADITVELGSRSFFDAPPQVDLNQWSVSETNDNRQLTQDARSILHEALSSVTNTTDNICLVFVPSLRNQSRENAGHATASYWYIRSIDSAYTDHCLISVSQMTSFVSAHELCHVLGVSAHSLEKCNLMFSTTFPFTDVTSSKRLNTYQSGLISAGEL